MRLDTSHGFFFTYLQRVPDPQDNNSFAGMLGFVVDKVFGDKTNFLYKSLGICKARLS